MSGPRPGLPRWAAVTAIAGAGVFAAVDAVLVHRAGYPWYQSIPDALVGWAYISGGVIAFRAAYITGGVVAFRARRLDRTGTLMTAIGVTLNLDNVAFYVHALVPYAAWLGNLVDPLLAQLLLSYPSRALRSRLERAVLAAAYAQVLVVNGVRVVFLPRNYYPCPCVHSFPTVHNPAVFRALETEVQIAYVIIGTAVLALVFRRWQRSSGPERRALNPLWFAGLATITALILEEVLGFAGLTPAQQNVAYAVVSPANPSTSSRISAVMVARPANHSGFSARRAGPLERRQRRNTSASTAVPMITYAIWTSVPSARNTAGLCTVGKERTHGQG